MVQYLQRSVQGRKKKKKSIQTYRGFWLAQVASSLFLSHLRDVSFLDVCSNQRKTDTLVLPVQKMKIKTHSLYLHPRVTVHTRICCFPEEVCSHLEKPQYPGSERLQLSHSCNSLCQPGYITSIRERVMGELPQTATFPCIASCPTFRIGQFYR